MEGDFTGGFTGMEWEKLTWRVLFCCMPKFLSMNENLDLENFISVNGKVGVELEWDSTNCDGDDDGDDDDDFCPTTLTAMVVAHGGGNGCSSGS